MNDGTAVYLRISDDKTGEAVGVINQEGECDAMCNRNGWTNRETYVDNDISATEGLPREDYDRLIADIEAGKIARVVVFHLSRLWRNRTERAEGIEIFRRRGVNIVCAKGPSLDLSNAYGRGMAAMLGEIDTMEVEIKAERQMLANRARAVAGEPAVGGPRPFGYKSGGRELDEVEEPLVKEMFERWVAGATLGEITRWLNSLGVRTPRGNVWKAGSVRAVLINPRYAGLRGVRWLAYDDAGRPVLDRKGRHRRIRYHEIAGRATWPGIVDEDVWREALARVQDPARAQTYIGRDRKYLLPSISECAICRRPMKSAFNNKKQRSGQRSIKCPTTRHAHRYAKPIEDYVQDVILERLRRPDAIDLVQPKSPQVDLRTLRDEAEAIRTRMRKLAQDEVLGRKTTAEVEAAREVAVARLTEIDRQIEAAGHVDVVARFVGTGRDPGEVWEDSATTISMRVALVSSMARIEIGPGRPGRPPKSGADEPPINVKITWKR